MPTSDVVVSDSGVTITSGLYDTQDGIVLKVAGDAFPRLHLTPQGDVLTGDGTAAPTDIREGGQWVSQTMTGYASLSSLNTSYPPFSVKDLGTGYIGVRGALFTTAPAVVVTDGNDGDDGSIAIPGITAPYRPSTTYGMLTVACRLLTNTTTFPNSVIIAQARVEPNGTMRVFIGSETLEGTAVGAAITGKTDGLFVIAFDGSYYKD